VVKKYGDDQAGNLAALIAFYGFFSLFPLLLVFVSILGLLLQGNPQLQQSITDSALKELPGDRNGHLQEHPFDQRQRRGPGRGNRGHPLGWARREPRPRRTR
jgi:hypothetical protein